jgi:hypothetical protein
MTPVKKLLIFNVQLLNAESRPTRSSGPAGLSRKFLNFFQPAREQIREPARQNNL